MNVPLLCSSPVSWHKRPSSIARDSTSAWTRWLGFSLLLREWIRRLGRDFSTTCPVVLDRWWPWTTLSLPRSTGASGSASSRAASFNFAHEQRLNGPQTQSIRSGLTQSLWRIPTGASHRRTVCFSYPQPSFRFCYNPGHSLVRKRKCSNVCQRQSRPVHLGSHGGISCAGNDLLRGRFTGRQSRWC